MSGKPALANPFASTGTSTSLPSFESAIKSQSSSVPDSSLPPGLGLSRVKKDDPWKEHNFQRRVRSLHSLETFGDPGGLDDDDDDENEDGDSWAQSYLTQNAQAPKRQPTSAKRTSNQWNCRNCDRDFFSEDALEAHVAEHETCGVDGCPYTAHPQLVLNHYKTQHLTGLAGKVWKVQTPEEIAKWREERKRNFPTVARVAQRKLEMRERKKRGNVLNNQYFGKINGETRGLINDFRGGRGGRGMSRGNRGNGRGGARNFRPIDNEFDVDSDHISSDDEGGLPVVDVSKLQEPVSEQETSSMKESSPTEASVGILGSLACAYASSDEEDEADESKGPLRTNEDKTKPDDGVVAKVDDAAHPASSTPKKNRKRKKRKSNDGKPEVVERLLTDGQVKYQLTKKRQRREPTLLERLLAPEIRRERNYILQCVRYIVRKNFFDD